MRKSERLSDAVHDDLDPPHRRHLPTIASPEIDPATTAGVRAAATSLRGGVLRAIASISTRLETPVAEQDRVNAAMGDYLTDVVISGAGHTDRTLRRLVSTLRRAGLPPTAMLVLGQAARKAWGDALGADPAGDGGALSCLMALDAALTRDAITAMGDWVGPDGRSDTLEIERAAAEAAATLAPPTTEPATRPRRESAPDRSRMLREATLALWRAHLDEVETRIDVLDRAAMAARGGALHEEGRGAAEGAAHKLAGTCGTYGFPEASAHAGEAEELLAVLRDRPARPDDAERLAVLARGVREAIGEEARPGGGEEADECGDGMSGPPDCGERLPTTHSQGPEWDGGLEEHFAAIEDACASILEGTLSPRLRAEAERSAHELVRVCGGLGRSDAAVHALDCANLIEGMARRPATPEDGARLAELVENVRTAMPGPTFDYEKADDAPGEVLLLDRDPVTAARIATAGTDMGLVVRAARTPADAVALAAAHRPRAAILELHVDEDDAVRELLRDLAADGAHVVVTVGPDAHLDRVELVRSGAVEVVTRPFSPQEVIARLKRRAHASGADEPRILLVDDDLVLLDAAGLLCRRAGLDVVTESDPARLWDALEASAPDLLVLDVEMPGASGIELCRALRADPRWQWLPILMLTALPDTRAAQQAFEVGADDYLTKPLDELALVTRIRNRLNRSETASVASWPQAPTGPRPSGDDIGAVSSGAAGPLVPTSAPPPVDVVVVDDDDAISALIVYALENAGHRVVALTDGQEAARLLAGDEPEVEARVVLLDVSLPGLDGLGVLRRMAAAGVLARTRVVMVTMRSSEDEVLEALRVGAFDHLAKPVSIPILVERVNRAMRS